MEKQYKYMVCTECMTYNQETFIADAIKGFVIQETTFPFINVIIDDASTDKTVSVLQQYATDHIDIHNPDAYERDTDYAHIVFGPLKTNCNCWFAFLFLRKNHRRRFLKLPYLSEWLETSKYHALCEGDDYWIDPLKLQKQVDYMEAHPNCSMCCHNAYREKAISGKRIGTHNIYSHSRIVERVHLFRDGGFIPTASYFFRLSLFWPVYSSFPVNPCADDIRMQVVAAITGEVYYIDEVMSVYRLNNNSVTHQAMKDVQIQVERQMKFIEWYRQSDDYTKHQFFKAFDASIAFCEARIIRLNKDFFKLWNPRCWPYLRSLSLTTRLGLIGGMLGLSFLPELGKHIKKWLR